MREQKAKQLLRQAIKNMLTEDAAHGPSRSLLQTPERNITAILQGHIETERGPTLPTHQVDHEYGQMGSKGLAKRVPKIGLISPDILIHRRGVTADKDPASNRLAVEVKVIPAFNGFLRHIKDQRAKERLKRDLDKLDALRSRGGEFRYICTACVVFSKEQVWLALNGRSFKKFLDIRSLS